MPRKKSLPIWDKRMLLLMKHCIQSDLVFSQKEFLQSIGFDPSALKDVRNGLRSFTIKQMVTACKRYSVSIAWLTGFSSEMKYSKSKTALQSLKDAVRAIEAEMS